MSVFCRISGYLYFLITNVKETAYDNINLLRI